MYDTRTVSAVTIGQEGNLAGEAIGVVPIQDCSQRYVVKFKPQGLGSAHILLPDLGRTALGAGLRAVVLIPTGALTLRALAHTGVCRQHEEGFAQQAEEHDIPS